MSNKDGVINRKWGESIIARVGMVSKKMIYFSSIIYNTIAIFLSIGKVLIQDYQNIVPIENEMRNSTWLSHVSC